MKLFHAHASPFARKCLVCVHELGLQPRVELLATSVHPVNRNREVVARNPLGKIPTLLLDDGTALYDSRVICEYLDTLAGGSLLPAPGPARWAALVDQSLGDGIADAAVLARYEQAVRPEPLRWSEWVTGQLEKVRSALAELERRATQLRGRVDIGTIAVACALGYLDFRFASLAWRDGHPHVAGWYAEFGARASMMATQPPAA